MIGSWFSDMKLLSWAVSGTAGGRAVGAQAPEDDLGLVDREPVVVGSGQAGRLPHDPVPVDDRATRPAHDVVVVVADAPFEPGRVAGGLDAGDQARRGERVQGLVH